MRKMWKLLAFVLVTGLIACGGQEGTDEGATEADTTAGTETGLTTETAGLTTPSWMLVDQAAQTVKLEISAGSEAVNNYWNYNGLYAGNGSITVPQGYAVTINFVNADPAQPHSLGIGERMDAYPAMFENPQPAFAGAITPDAATGTAPQGTASITFTADRAGEFAMICYVPGHAVAGMVIPFNVSADGQAGVSQ
jgi:FtsP/CotA-like multicopper oxidase with cupredoxin domain